MPSTSSMRQQAAFADCDAEPQHWAIKPSEKVLGHLSTLGSGPSKSRIPNLHSQGNKLLTAVQAPAWLKKDKPGASQCLLKPSRAAHLLTLSSAEPPGLPEAPQTPAELPPDKTPSCPIPHTSKSCSSKRRCDVIFSHYIINCSQILMWWTLVLMLWGAWLIQAGFTEPY